MRHATIFTSAITALLACTSAVAQPVTIRNLSMPPGLFVTQQPVRVSDDGRVVVATCAGVGSGYVVRWIDGGLPVVLLGSELTVAEATGLSGDGRFIVGELRVGIQRQAFRYSDETGLELVAVGATSIGETRAKGVSRDGSVVVGVALGFPFRWTNSGGLVTLQGVFDGASTSGDGDALGISPDGTTALGIVPVGNGSGSRRPCRWVGTTLSLLDPVEQTQTDFANAIAASANGAVIVGRGYRSSVGQLGFTWNGSYSPIGPFPNSGSNSIEPTSCSLDSSVVVGYSASAGHPSGAFVWSARNGVASLQTILSRYGIPSAQFDLGTAARATVSGDGRTVVGGYTIPASAIETVGIFVATIADPSALPPLLFPFGPTPAIGAAHPLTAAIPTHRRAGGPIHINATARLDLGATVETIDVRLNGVSVGALFAATGHDCPSEPDTDQLIIPAATFNAALASGPAIISLVPSAAVDPFLCGQSFLSFNVAYSPELTDCNADGQDDYEQIALGQTCDTNGNEIPDTCEPINPCPTDFNRDCTINPDDIADFITAFFTQPPATESDYNADGTTDPDDLADFITAYFAGSC